MGSPTPFFLCVCVKPRWRDTSLDEEMQLEEYGSASFLMEEEGKQPKPRVVLPHRQAHKFRCGA